MIKKMNCLKCGKELINLNELKGANPAISEFWCDDCNIDFDVTENNLDTEETHYDLHMENDTLEHELSHTPIAIMYNNIGILVGICNTCHSPIDESIDNPKCSTCGHSVLWDHESILNHIHCPICKEELHGTITDEFETEYKCDKCKIELSRKIYV